MEPEGILKGSRRNVRRVRTHTNAEAKDLGKPSKAFLGNKKPNKSKAARISYAAITGSSSKYRR
jgi:hypothetical protein